MQKYSVDVDLGDSGFNFFVQAENDIEAAELACRELDCRGIANDEIEKLRITLL
jgi:hypothetical protein